MAAVAAAWLKVTRNTLTHEISAVEPAAGAACREGWRVMAGAQTNRLDKGGLIDRDGAAELPLRRQELFRLPGRHAGVGADRQWRQAGRPLVQVPSPARHPDVRLGRAQRAGRTVRTGARREPNIQGDDGRALRGARGRQPEPLAVAAPRCRCRSTSCSRRSSSPASTTRPSCGRRNSGKRSTSRSIRRAAGLGRAASA